MGKPVKTLMTDEDLLVHPEMIGTDQADPPTWEQSFKAEACEYDGCGGRKSIDTMYENTSQDVVENPREKTTPAPVSVNGGMYPHRRL